MMSGSTIKARHMLAIIASVCLAMPFGAVQGQNQKRIIIAAKDSAKVIEHDTLSTVTVTGGTLRRRMNNVEIGAEAIAIKELAKMPSLFGEQDIMKSIQLLPGVKSEGDGSSGYQVRGGTSAQNLVLLDNASIYNSGHLLGFFSAFNDDALTNATLYKGQMPSQFGGGVSSVFDISTKTGNMQEHHYGASIGLLSAKAYAEGPLKEDKASYFASARRSYLDIFLKATDDYRDTKMNFYDVNAKMSYKLKNGDDIMVSFFTGRDNMGLKDILEMKWSNVSVSSRWYHAANDKMYVNTSLYYSQFRDDISFSVMKYDYEMEGYIRQWNAMSNWTILPNAKLKVRAGGKIGLITLQSAKWRILSLNQEEKRKAISADWWCGSEWKATERLEISAGLRLTTFMAMGGAPYYEMDAEGNIERTLRYGKRECVASYVTPEPRASIKWKQSEQTNIKMGYARTSQHIHAIRNSTSASMPFDRYAMSSNLIRPQEAHQLSAGWMRKKSDGSYDLSVECYYKTVKNVYDYRDGKSFASEIEMERLVKGGKGRSYGMEICGHKNSGKWTGWASYTLSWSENKIAGINHGRWYDATNDRRHDINLVSTIALGKGWEGSAAWTYTTGQALTAPSAKYEMMGDTYYYYAERNGYRAPSYHRLDVSATHTKHLRGKLTRKISIGIYNLYGRHNPYMILFVNDDEKETGSKCEQIALFSVVPSFTYGINF